jgi:hypothetical protein
MHHEPWQAWWRTGLATWRHQVRHLSFSTAMLAGISVAGTFAAALQEPPFLTTFPQSLVSSTLESMLLLSLMLLPVAWLVGSTTAAVEWTDRLASRTSSVLLAEFLALMAAGSACVLIALLGVVTVVRIPAGWPPASLLSIGMTVVLSYAPVAALAPGLARLRLPRSSVVALSGLLVTGSLGLFGQTFPLHADTLTQHAAAAAPDGAYSLVRTAAWSVLACLAGTSASHAIAKRTTTI